MKRIKDFFLVSLSVLIPLYAPLLIVFILFSVLFYDTNFYKKTFITTKPYYKVIEGGAIYDTFYNNSEIESGDSEVNGIFDTFEKNTFKIVPFKMPPLTLEKAISAEKIRKDSLLKKLHDDSIRNRVIDIYYFYTLQYFNTGEIKNISTRDEYEIGKIEYIENDRFEKNWFFFPLYIWGISLFIFIIKLTVVHFFKSFKMPSSIIIKNKINSMRYKILIVICIIITLFSIFNPTPQSFFYYIKGKEHYVLARFDPSTYREKNYLLFSIYRFDNNDNKIEYYWGVLGNFYKKSEKINNNKK